MARILSVLSAPGAGSRTDAVGVRAARHLAGLGHDVDEFAIRDLPAAALLWRDVDHPAVAAALARVEEADALIVTSAVYQSSFTAPVKAFLDLFPMNGLRDKFVLPLMVGGSPGHVLALDYGLRPVLQSLAPAHVAAGRYILASGVRLDAVGRASFEDDAAADIDRAASDFASRLDATEPALSWAS